MATATKTRTPRIDIDRRTGEARCSHRDCWGNVCDECFHARPFLFRVGDQAYRMTGSEWTDSPDMVDGTSPFVEMSRATPQVQVISLEDVRPEDQILGYTNSPTAPLLVQRVHGGGKFTVSPGKAILITDPQVAVVRRHATPVKD